MTLDPLNVAIYTAFCNRLPNASLSQEEELNQPAEERLALQRIHIQHREELLERADSAQVFHHDEKQCFLCEGQFFFPVQRH